MRAFTNFLKKLDVFHLFTPSRQDIYNEKQFDLQKQQFEYQKWYDANNIQLQTQDSMKAGINPLVGANGSSTAVASSAQPQMPDENGSQVASLLSDMVGKVISAKEHKDELDLERDKLDLAKKTQKDQNTNYENYLAIMRARAGADVTRTGTYGDVANAQNSESNARKRQILHDLEMQLAAEYGRQSSIYKKIFGELKQTFGSDFFSVPDSWKDGLPPLGNPAFSDSNPKPKPKQTDYSDDFAKYKRAVQSGYKGSFEDWSYLNYGKR